MELGNYTYEQLLRLNIAISEELASRQNERKTAVEKIKMWVQGGHLRSARLILKDISEAEVEYEFILRDGDEFEILTLVLPSDVSRKDAKYLLSEDALRGELYGASLAENE